MRPSRTIADVIMGRDWVVARTIWPFPDGWGTYNPKTHTIMDTGLSKEEAQARCDALNSSPPINEKGYTK
jgi:hypothetical protein